MAPTDPVTPSADGALIDAMVQPRASRERVECGPDGRIRIRVVAPPVDDRANRAVEALVAGLVGVPRSRVAVVAGRSSRRKRIEVRGVSAAHVTSSLLSATSR